MTEIAIILVILGAYTVKGIAVLAIAYLGARLVTRKRNARTNEIQNDSSSTDHAAG